MEKRDIFGNSGTETQQEDRRRWGGSASGFGIGELSMRKALPFVLVAAMLFSIAVVAVSGDMPMMCSIKPKVHQSSVYPLNGTWQDSFTYLLNITSPESSKPRKVIVTLQIYQPANNTFEVKDEINQTWVFTTNGGRNEKSFTVEPFIALSRDGISSYQFLYEDEMQRVTSTLGPYPGPCLPKPPVEFPHVDFYRRSGPNTTDEAYYDMDTGETTAFDYNVTAESNSDIWFDISLRVHDPVKNVWMLKGDNLPTYFSANETEPLIWPDIRPFESLNKSRIGEYIGKQSNFTFVYPGDKSENFIGPRLVVAFKDQEMNPKKPIAYNNYTHSIKVNACRNLNITLQYYDGTEWVHADTTEPTQNYTRPYEWQLLEWDCKATFLWEKVRFVWGT